MPEPGTISKSQADYVFRQLGYTAIEHGEIVIYRDDRYENILEFDFGMGPIPWVDFKRGLETEGINVDAFLAYLEMM